MNNIPFPSADRRSEGSDTLSGLVRLRSYSKRTHHLPLTSTFLSLEVNAKARMLLCVC